jgi:hypothetical protein
VSDLDTSPVSLPAGGFDYEKLKDGLQEAAQAGANRGEDVAKALETAREGDPAVGDTSLMDGYEVRQVGEEKIQIFMPPADAVEPDAATEVQVPDHDAEADEHAEPLNEKAEPEADIVEPAAAAPLEAAPIVAPPANPMADAATTAAPAAPQE